MRTFSPIVLLLFVVPVAKTAGTAAAAPPGPEIQSVAKPAELSATQPPKTGSRISPDDNNCVQCHGDPDLWDLKDPKAKLRYISRDGLADDVHWRKGVNCHDCHGGNYKTTEVNEAHAKENGFRGAGAAAREMCGVCHDKELLELRKSVHAKAGEKDEQGRGTLLGCRQCHGADQHHILPVADKRSPVFVNHQVETCGKCHEHDRDTYGSTSHGHGLYESGLLVTATCANCHGAHGIYYAANTESTLHPSNVSATCGKCHSFIAERLKDSVHGQSAGPGKIAERLAPGGKSQRHPSCTDCHQKHEIVLTESARYRRLLPNFCANCHGDLSKRYAMTVHGELTELGYQPAANCHNCHGSHSILGTANAASLVSAENRVSTCRECHPHATARFAAFNPHVDYHDPHSNPAVYWVYRLLLTLLFTTFGVFGLHAVLWFVRGVIAVVHEGRPKGLVPGHEAYVRFVPMHRWAHAVLLASFLGLALTGLPLRYSHHDWAKNLATCLGGFESTSFWHRVCALVTFTCFGIYMVHLARQFVAAHRSGAPWLQVFFGPDSPLPNWRDVKDFFKMLRWFVGLGPKPTFERWAYWEKFDFWGACTDIVIIGSTGLLMWFPNFFCSFLPGVTLNVAKVIHSTQALLATGFVFAIHFFSIHLRAEKFPADMSLLVGLVSEEEFRAERPEYLERLRREGALDERRATVPSKWRMRLIKMAGFLALGVGLALLAGIAVASLGG